MWGSSEEPPGTMEAGPPKSVANLKETCEQSKNQLETVKDIMLRNKQSLKKKEEELQEYAKKLSKFKTRKPIRPPKDSATSSSESTPKSKSDLSITEPTDDNVDEVSQARTPKAKSSLLQKKLAEDRKIFERRSRELTENKRAVEEKVEALRQQLEETYVAPVVAVNPVLITSQTTHNVLDISNVQDRDNKITELNSKILELEAIIIDLQDNLKEKDSVIDSKTKAITLMSADLSRKGKTTLDNLEDTKDEMRSMQQNFILVEESLKNKNDNLLKQLEEKTGQVSELEETVESLTQKLEAQKQADSISADFSRSTMDTLAETKDAMKGMQENFVLIESSLKSKNEHLLKQLEEREMKLAESEARILSLESGVGIQRHPDLEDLLYKIEKLEKTNHDLQDEKYELQKSIAELQEKIIGSQVEKVDDSLVEKDTKIVELEALIQELKSSEESLKEKLQSEVNEFNEENKVTSNEKDNKILELEALIQDLKSSEESLKEKLQSELETLEKNKDALDARDSKIMELETLIQDLKSSEESLKEKLKFEVNESNEKNKDASDEKDNKIVELEALIQELKSSEESSKEKLQSELETFIEKNKDMSDKLSQLETQVETLSSEKAELIQQLSARESDTTDGDDKLDKLSKELDEANKSMIKLKAQHKNKLKNMQKQLESFKKVSDTNAELVKLGNQVAMLEEEKGNLQLSLVDFDELKASAAELKERTNELEGKVSSQSKEIEAHIQAIAILENQKLDLMQELHAVKQEVSDLEAENAESDNLRVSAEMKVVELEEQLESSHKLADEHQQRLEDLQHQLDSVSQENEQLVQKVAKLEELKSSSESFAKTGSNVDSTESFEALAPEVDRSADLLRKIEDLTRDNEALQQKLARHEEKAASSSEDSGGSSESFERIAPVEQIPAVQQQQQHQDEDKLTALEQQIEQSNALLAEQTSQLEELKLKLAEKEEELERVSSKEVSSPIDNEQLEALRLEAEQWQRKTEQLEESKEALREQLESAIASLEHKLAEQSETINARDGLVDELRERLRVNEDQAEELREQLRSLEARVQERDEQLTKLTEELAAATSNLGAADEELAGVRRQVSELQASLERSHSPEEHNELLERLNEREVKLVELESRLAQRLTEVNELRERTDALEMENERLGNQLRQEESHAAELLEANEAQRTELRDSELAKAELENRLLDLRATHDESLSHAGQLGQELRDAYRMLEQLKIKHTEDSEMGARRLEDLLEELQQRNQELANLRSDMESEGRAELAELQARATELVSKLAEAEDKEKAQLEKMKKYAALAKKKTAQCEELETKLKELEDSLNLEKSEKEARNKELQESREHAHEKDNRIVELEEQLQLVRTERDEAHERTRALEMELQDLSEAKDNARELGVRMQVMEAEYVEQLSEINSLKTSNGLLLSKQAQISERLENVEKESEERRALLEKLEKEKEIEDSRRAEGASRLQELEAKLHERDAEIENLDNELHNSIDNLVQMQENLRLTSVSAESQAGLQQSYDELLAQFEALRSSNSELSAKHNSLIQENEELVARFDSLQQLNISMQQRIEAVENELSSKEAQAAASLEELNIRYGDLLRQLDAQQAELEATRHRLHEALASSENTEHQLRARVSLLEQEKHNLQRELEDAKSFAVETNLPTIDELAAVREVVAPSAQSPALFDASVFGTSPSADRDLDQFLLGGVKQPEQQPHAVESNPVIDETSHESLEDLKATIASMETALSESQDALRDRDTHLEALELQLEQLRRDKDQLDRSIDATLANMGVTHEDTIAKSTQLEDTVVQLLLELQALRSNNEQLSAAEEVCKNRAIELDNRLRAASESTIIAELEERIARTIGERDLLQLQLNDATRSIDDHKLQFQQQLDSIAAERDHLKVQQQSSSIEEPQVEVVAASIQENALASMWDEDEEDPWGFKDDRSSKEDHVHIPVVPSAELQLKLRLDELEEKLTELAEENAKLRDEGKIAQLKNVKYVKKLKEYKVQLDSVQQQLKSQSSFGGLGDLDTAIQEELNARIVVLEKEVAEAKEDSRKVLAEKDNLLKRIDVLTAATERFTEAKERQDTEVHIWQMRYNELDMKMRQMEATPATPSQDTENCPPPSSSSVDEQQIKELRDSVEALAAENEELQQLLEEQRAQIQDSLHSKNALEALQVSNAKLESDYELLKQEYEQKTQDNDNVLEELRASKTKLESDCELLRLRCEQNSQDSDNILEDLRTSNAKLKSDYELLRRQYEQSLMDADEQVQSTRQSCEFTKNELSERCEQLEQQLGAALDDKTQLENKIAGLELSIEGYTVQVQEKDALIHSLQEDLQQKNSAAQPQNDVPVFTFSSDNDDHQEIERLRGMLQAKEAEIEHLSYSLNEAEMTRMVQELQDSVNCLYNEKAELENRLAERDHLIAQLEESRKENEGARRSEGEDDRVEKLERELQEREQDVQILKARLNEIESHSRESAADEQLRSELVEKQMQLEGLQLTVSDLQKEIENLRSVTNLEREDRAIIEQLTSEKEGIKRQAEESIAKLLQQKEDEIGFLKEQLASEKQSLLETLGLKDQDLEQVKHELEQVSLEYQASIEERTRLEFELSERDRRVAELSINKDTDIHELSVRLNEANARLEEVVAMSEEEQRQLSELRQLLQVKEQQISGLQQQLQEKVKEYELMQLALQRHVGQAEHSPEVQQQLEQSASESVDSSSANELDVALYMLHQRDVRCEELTLELMQLLEERDTLQLRLSNAIRVNEELRKYATSTGSSPKKDFSSSVQPLVENPSPSTSEGPVEIAKEAIDSPNVENGKALAQKLSQLKTVHHTKDVRVRDERELRNTQQMSLLAHKDALNTLPPEAAARLHANYTVSRDVQSQSSILMNWLWGKSTPKVVHM